MAGAKLPPRQKMIGLMYLVLLALLAMNVSKDILEAFVTINDGLETTAKTFSQSNSIVYGLFDKAASENAVAAKYRDKAYSVKKKADVLAKHIQDLKSKLYQVIDKIEQPVADTINLEHISAKDNYDEPTRIMGIADPAKPIKSKGFEEYSATTLREMITDYYNTSLGVFEKISDKETIEEKIRYLKIEDGKGKGGAKEYWEVKMFYHSPLAAVITMLSKIEADIYNAESEVISKLYENIDAGGVSFNKIEGFTYSSKTFVVLGDSFKTQIFTAAYDDRVEPEIFVYSRGGSMDTNLILKGETDENKIMKGQKGERWGDDWFQLKTVKGGKGYLSLKEGVGQHEWGGIIKLSTKKGIKVYPFKSSFEVGKTSTAVAASKMNVFYVGIDNPVTVSAPMPNFKASAPGMRSTKQKGKYIIKPSKPGQTTVVVTGIDENGKKIKLGSEKFRVKRIPDPVAKLSGKTGSFKIRKIIFFQSNTLKADLENFDFDVKVKVSSFKFSTVVGGLVREIPVKGNKLNAKCKRIIKKASKNQKFFVEDIQVRMPDGTKRKLSPIIVTVI